MAYAILGCVSSGVVCHKKQFIYHINLLSGTYLGNGSWLQPDE